MAELWNDERTAEYLGIKAATLVAWRNRGVSPPYVKVGRLRRYRKEDLDRWQLEQIATMKEIAAKKRRRRLREAKARAEAAKPKPRPRLRSEK
jgi:excisionase family DNA binding protein